MPRRHRYDMSETESSNSKTGESKSVDLAKVLGYFMLVPDVFRWERSTLNIMPALCLNRDVCA